MGMPPVPPLRLGADAAGEEVCWHPDTDGSLLYTIPSARTVHSIFADAARRAARAVDTTYVSNEEPRTHSVQAWNQTEPYRKAGVRRFVPGAGAGGVAADAAVDRVADLAYGNGLLGARCPALLIMECTYLLSDRALGQTAELARYGPDVGVYVLAYVPANPFLVHQNPVRYVRTGFRSWVDDAEHPRRMYPMTMHTPRGEYVIRRG